MEGKDVKQVKNVMYLGENISENGRVEVEVRRRIQAEANAWIDEEGVMMDRTISRKPKGMSWITAWCQLVHMAWRR